MLSIDWTMIVDRLMRYYFPALFLLPTMLVLVCLDKQVVRTNRKPVFALCILLALMILADVFEVWLATLPNYTIWRVAASVPGFCLRPVCLLLLLLDTIPGIEKDRKKQAFLVLPAVVNAVVFISAFFCPLAFFYDDGNDYQRGPLFFVVIVVSVLYLLWLAVSAVANLQRRNRRRAAIVIFITVACFAASILEMNGVAYPAPLLNQTIAISAVLYFLAQYMADSADTIENMTLSLLLMQIRPHFINNSLAAIRGMIRKDPDEAVEALNHFSGYLQNSMNSITKTNLISFTEELELIDNYLYMEKMRFRDSITITKELMPVDFLVPPLTVQPLVENAVRHGLRGSQKPGCLTIRTEMDAKECRITVEDNGCGFDPTQPPDNRRPHVGLKNVRTRLELMCSGRLDIRSSPDGTIATIHIPAKQLGSLQAGKKEQ